jgi:hypothetical protein
MLTMATTNTGTPPMLLPLPRLAERAGGPRGATRSAPVEDAGAGRRSGAERSDPDSPSLPFSGFSLLALVLAGVGSIAAGRRLEEAIAAAAPEPAAAQSEPAAPPAPAGALTPTHPVQPRASRAPIYAAAALFAVAAVAASRSR